MEERLTVFVNDKPVTVFRGMTVKHALIAFDYTLYRDVRDGKAVVKDENGFSVGLGGALHEGARFYLDMAGRTGCR
jgi:hypothetical protein